MSDDQDNRTPESALLPEAEYVGGPCPDPRHCRYWLSHANGPWTCEACHPRETRAAESSQTRPPPNPLQEVDSGPIQRR
jgi:hypothetical protein